MGCRKVRICILQVTIADTACGIGQHCGTDRRAFTVVLHRNTDCLCFNDVHGISIYLDATKEQFTYKILHISLYISEFYRENIGYK